MLHLGVERDSGSFLLVHGGVSFLPRPGWTQDVQTNWALCAKCLPPLHSFFWMENYAWKCRPSEVGALQTRVLG